MQDPEEEEEDPEEDPEEELRIRDNRSSGDQMEALWGGTSINRAGGAKTTQAEPQLLRAAPPGLTCHMTSLSFILQITSPPSEPLSALLLLLLLLLLFPFPHSSD